MKGLSVALVIGVIIIAIWLNSKEKQKEDRPNIVFLLADDLGYNELGSYGQKIIQTPHLDQLAKKGLRFTNFYAGNAVCSPSRAVLLTGVSASFSPIRGNAAYLGDERWQGLALDQGTFTLGELLQKAGYQTAFIGKWHLDDPNDVATWACNHGFDFAAQEQWTARFGGRKFPPNRLWINGNEAFVPYDYKLYDCKDALRTDLAIIYLDSIDREDPFFLFMSYRAPHSFEGPIRDTQLYADQGWPEIERIHAAKITLLDKQVGRLLEKLQSINELENTLILFTSDNGPHFSEKGHQLEFFDSNGPFKGGKRDLYEGGLKVPLIAYWENKILPETVTNQIAAFQDIMPTFAEVAQTSIPEQSNGLSILPILTGEESLQREYLNWEIQLSGWFQTLPEGGFRQAMRQGDWKLVKYGANKDAELFNLKTDSSESINLAHQYPNKARKMELKMNDARTETTGFPFGGRVQLYKSQDLQSDQNHE